LLDVFVRLGDDTMDWAGEGLMLEGGGRDLSEDRVTGPFFGVSVLDLFGEGIMLDAGGVGCLRRRPKDSLPLSI